MLTYRESGKLKRHGLWLGICFSLVFVLWILRSFDLQGTVVVLSSASYIYLLPVCALILINFVLRAQRWRALFTGGPVPGFFSSFVALMAGYLANNVLPARAGEIVRSYILSRREKLPVGVVLATVTIERIGELVVILLMAGVSLLLGPFPPWAEKAGAALALLALLSLVLLMALGLARDRHLSALKAFLRLLPSRIAQRVGGFGSEFIGALRRQGRKNAALFLGFTLPIWCSEILIMFVLARAFNLPLSFSQSLFVIIMVGIGTSIPSSPGFIGTYEFFFTSSLAILGIGGGPALGLAVATHAVTFVSSNMLGLVSMLLSGTSMKSLSGEPGKTRLSAV